MDSLKPILEQKFWILVAAAALLVGAGWWVDTNAQIATIDKRTSDVDASRRKLTTLEKGEKINTSWAEALHQVNSADAQELWKATQMLMASQKSLMVWPEGVRAQMEGVPYRGEIPDFIRDKYGRTVYGPEYERVLSTAHPFTETVDPITSVTTVSGKMVVERDQIPIAPYRSWTTFMPKSRDVWDAQEDLWLLESFFRTIDELNNESTMLNESPVREISALRFRGGNPLAVATAATPAAAAAPAAASPEEAAPANETPEQRRARLRREQREEDEKEPEETKSGPGFKRSNSSQVKTLSEEYGAPVANPDAPPAGRPGAPGTPAAPEPEKEGGGLGRGLGRLGDGEEGIAANPALSAEAIAKMKRHPGRYVHNDDAEPFVTRAFLLNVTMDSRRVPDLIVALTNMPWAVQIDRVHQSDLYDGKTTKAPRSSSLKRRGFRGGGEKGDRDSAPAGTALGPQGARGTGRPASGPIRTGGDPRTVAMNDPYLVDVEIIGLLTLFKPDGPEAPAEIFKEIAAAIPPAAPPETAAAPASEPAAAPAAETTSAPPAAEAAPAAAETAATPAESAEQPPVAETPTDGTAPPAETPPAAETPATEAPAADGSGTPPPAEESPPAQTPPATETPPASE